MRHYLLCLAAVLALLQPLAFLVLAGCASSDNKLTPEGLTLAEAQTQLDQLPAPAGMPAAQFAALRQALSEQLAASGQQRWVSAAPVDAQNRVSDLTLEKIDEASAQAHWSYLNVGDYDQNSEVNIADLAPVGANYKKNSASPGWSTAQVADGDNNGEVNIADVTPLGLHIQNSVEGYQLQASATPEVEASWLPVASAMFADSTQATPGARRTFSATVPAVSGMSFRVVPFLAATNGIPGVPFAYTGQSGGGLTFAQRQEVFDLIAEKMLNLVGTTSDEQDAEIADYIATLPHIEEAGAVAGNAWGRFDDEMEFVVCKNHAPADAGQVASLRESLQEHLPGISNSRSASSGLPQTQTGSLLWGYGNGPLYSDPTEDLSLILNDAGYGDTNEPIGVGPLRNVFDYGYLYIDSPAGFSVGRDGTPKYWIRVGEPFNASNEAFFEDDIVTRRLGYMYAMDANGVWSWTYSFGAKFVKYYMSFSQNSFVYLNTARSAGAVDMVEQFHQAGASVVLAWWDSMPDSVTYNAARHLVDRLLGANEFGRIETPPIRPFNLTTTLFDMQARGVSASQPIYYPATPDNPYSNLIPLYNMFDPLNSFSLFRPIVEHLQVNIAEDGKGNVLEIYGDFGDTVGVLPIVHLELNNILTLVGMPSSTLLTCELPDSGFNSYGDIFVEMNGILSRPRRLTAWRGQLTYSEVGPGSLTRTIIFNLHFRADISGYRTDPDTNPLINEGNGIVPLFGAPDGFATVSCSGSYTDPSLTTITYSDAADTHMDQVYGVYYGNGDFTNSGSIDLSTGKITFVMPALAPYHEKKVNSEGTVVKDLDDHFYSDISFVASPAAEVFQLNLTDFSIEPGQFEKQVGDTLLTASWMMFPASAPPNPDAAR